MKPHPHSSINAALAARECPLCGQPNQCDMALGKSADNCWCMETAVSTLLMVNIFSSVLVFSLLACDRGENLPCCVS